MSSVMLAGLGAIALIALILLYNKLVRLKNMVNGAWADIDVQLQKRFELIPNLVEVVRGASIYEKGVLENVTLMRARIGTASTIGSRSVAENNLHDSVHALFAIAESYPVLQSNRNYLDLQQQLIAIEGDIECARRYYNAVVRDFNTLVESFPSNLVAKLFAYKQATSFSVEQRDVIGSSIEVRIDIKDRK